ncbi:MAG: alpha/beta fold hydrolase [Desulfobacteraceae bacterium]|nr:alpha/beta fold hydrolase [Desulfobacteraceae bacterium]
MKTFLRKKALLWVVLAVWLVIFPKQGWAHKSEQHHLFSVGDLKLESGQVIKDFAISYVTHGKLNANKSNAVLMCSSLVGNHHRIDFMIGPGKALDTSKYFVICTDAIGNGLSTSPSNSKAQPGPEFPAFNIRDMVRYQYRLLTEHLGIRHLVAVAGASMGGMQSLQWAVSYPDFMDAVVALSPAARVSAWGAAFWKASNSIFELDTGNRSLPLKKLYTK